jgi:phosphoribosylformylglycinamidine synthase
MGVILTPATQPTWPPNDLRSVTTTTPSLAFVQVSVREGLRDPMAAHALESLRAALPAAGLRSVRFVQGYVLECLDASAAAAGAAEKVLADPVTQTWSVNALPDPAQADVDAGALVVSVARLPGVMDPAEASCKRALAAIGVEADTVGGVRRYVVQAGSLTEDQLREAARKVLANEVIEEIRVGPEFDLKAVHPAPYRFQRIEVPIREAGDDELARISADMCLSLTVLEMQSIRAFFQEEGREPTDVELETLAQTWSEHCKHKTLAGQVHFTGVGGERSYDNLLKETVFQATKELGREDCLSVFVDNAGVIAFDAQFGVCMKVETHNHPSAIEPYGGAGTGIGGVIRDILGTGKGARPFMNTDVFCFARPDMPEEDVPKGCLHPRRIMHGVVDGVRDYGNRMGIPTASGGLFFDDRYVGNPVVYCGTLGLIPRGLVAKAAQPGDVIVAIGGRTGRDGIHGATFSSVELSEDSEKIGNPIEEKRVLDALLVARDEGLLNAVTDCGAGGFSSAVGEMGEETGAIVHLERAPLKYDGLSYAEIWISEAQERMVMAVSPENVARVREICEAEDVEVTELGHFTDDQRLQLFFHGEKVGDMPMGFLHDGLPRVGREAVWHAPEIAPFPWPEEPSETLGADLKAILSSWNVCSKEWVIRQYDHEVQGGSAIKPLVGVHGDGPGDAAVAAPVPGSYRGVAVACGMNPRLGDLEPHRMAMNATDEALRNLTAVGADPRRAALLDNFTWGNASKPDRLGSLVLASEGLRDAALAYGTPFVSGKDSLNNEFQVGGRTIAVPPTLLVSAFCVVDDVRKCVTSDLKEAGNRLYVVGITRDEMGGSHLGLVRGAEGGAVPEVRPEESLAVFDGVHRAMQAGTVRSCHDCSEGGLAVALAEMAFAGCLGIEAQLVQVPFEESTAGGVHDDALLFAESPGRLVCEVRPDDAERFEEALGDAPFALIGEVTDGDRVRIAALRGRMAVDECIEDLREAFTSPLREGDVQ